MLRVVIRNIASNWLGFFVQVVMVFLLTPFIIRSLGEDRYGAWALITSITGYYGLLDLGIRGGITQLVTYAIADRDYVRVNRTISTAVAIMAASAVLVLIGSCILASFATDIFTISGSVGNELRTCLVIVGFSVAAQLLFHPFAAVFAGTQRYDISNAIGVTTTLATACGTVICLSKGYSLVGLAIVTTVGSLAGYIIRWQISFRILPELSVSRSQVEPSGIRSILALSGWNFVGALGQQLTLFSSRIVVGIMLPIAAMVPFSLAIGLIEYATQIQSRAVVVLFPAIAHLFARRDTERLTRTYLIGSRYLTLGTVTIAAIGAIWANDFFALWVGEEVSSASEFQSPAVLFRVLAATLILGAGPGIGAQILYGCKKIPLAVQFSAIEGICSVVLSLLFVRTAGLLGAAAAIVVSALIVRSIALPIAVCRTLSIDPWHYFRQVLVRPFLYAAVLVPTLLGFRSLMPSPDRWFWLGVAGCVALTLSGLLMIPVGMTANERSSFIGSQLARLATALRRTGSKSGHRPPWEH